MQAGMQFSSLSMDFYVYRMFWLVYDVLHVKSYLLGSSFQQELVVHFQEKNGLMQPTSRSLVVHSR